MSNALVLLVEDDPLMIRFVELAVRALPVDLVVCNTLAQARLALARDPISLVITDLNLADGSGLELLAELPELARQAGSTLPTPKTMVCSGSIDDAMQARVLALNAWRVLRKPVPVAVLARTIAQGLSHIGEHPPGSTDLADRAVVPGDEAAQAQVAAVKEYFDGNSALFAAYSASFARQLPATLEAADMAWEQRDLPALGRSAHNLKTVLRTLGDPVAAELALQVEQAALNANLPAMHTHWPALRAALQLKTL